MTGREKIDAAVEYLKARKVGGSTAAPPLWRLFWALGLHVPPPHFLNFGSITLVAGLPFGLAISVFSFLVTSFAAGEPLAGSYLLLGCGGGLFFGLGLAAYYRWSAGQMGLPSWRDFGKYEGEEDANW